MKLQQLRFLFAVVNHDLSITAAAEVLYTSQPGISKQIRQLEDELGLKLFVRQGKRLAALTPAGERVISHAGKVLQEVEQIRKVAEEMRRDSKPYNTLV
jgi:LysR family cys regulon transcriptional activator